jgi:hypothetical protein
VGQVTAVGQAHAENGVARLQQRQIHRLVGLRAGVRLHVGVIGAKQLLDALNGQTLGHIHVFAAAVVALARIAFRVLVGQYRALGLQHTRAGVVFRGDARHGTLRPARRDRARQFRIKPFDTHGLGK